MFSDGKTGVRQEHCGRKLLFFNVVPVPFLVSLRFCKTTSLLILAPFFFNMDKLAVLATFVSGFLPTWAATAAAPGYSLPLVGPLLQALFPPPAPPPINVFPPPPPAPSPINNTANVPFTREDREALHQVIVAAVQEGIQSLVNELRASREGSSGRTYTTVATTSAVPPIDFSGN